MSTPAESLILKTFLTYMGASSSLGLLMPKNNSLSEIYEKTRLVTDLLPSIRTYSALSINPMFSETFLGIGLIFAFACLTYIVIRIPKGHKRFFSHLERYKAIALLVVGTAVLLGAAWFFESVPTAGRYHGMFVVATSSYLGIVSVLNFLMVGAPLFLVATVVLVVRSTDVM